MKAVKIFAVAIIALAAATSVKAQEFKASADIVSTYVWRGAFQSSAAIQPTLDFTAGGFSIGAWGSSAISQIFNGSDFSLMQEADLYAKYAFGFGLSLGVTDYYYTGNDYSYYKKGGSHSLEANLGYNIGKLSLSGNYLLNVNKDLYFEAGYAFDKVSVFLGAGNNVYSTDSKFAVVNMGASVVKEIKMTDSFTLPLKATAIFNPKSRQFFFVAGITL